MARTVPLNIASSDYEYPGDTEARARLSELRELRDFSRDFIARVAEPWLSGQLAGDAVRVTKTQLPWLYGIVAEVAALLEVPVPHVYVRHDPYLNAYTHGVGNQAFLAITHSLLEQLDEEELRFIIGHEIGHIKSQHVLYTTMAGYLLDDAKAQRSRNLTTLLMNLMEWQRESEITADRAGLLVCGDIGTACRGLLTLVVGSRKLAEQMDAREFAEDQDLALEFNPLAKRMELGRSHPFMPKRIKELLAFAESENYKNLLLNGITLQSNTEIGPELDIELAD